LPTDEGHLVAGRYRLGQRIGSGAMGVVWQAHDERLHRVVAVKQLLQQPGLSSAQAEEARLRSMREGRIAARLSHPNAITVYDVTEDGGQPWLIMEYLPSNSLAAVLQERGPLPPREAARIGAQIAAALTAAHAAGIVHRDVKPANVLIAEDGTVKITDFGISRAAGDVTVTATGMLTGTPAYLAPEVAKGENPTSQADVFSLGSTLYTSVEGHSPFGLSENTFALLHAVAAGKVNPPQSAGPLTALLMQLLRLDPAQRPTMPAAMEALKAVAEGRPIPSAPLPTPAPAYPVGNPAQASYAPSSPQYGQSSAPQVGNQTRLDAHPFAEPNPSPASGSAVDLVMAAAEPPATPAERRSSARKAILTALAIITAAAVGVLVATLLSDTGKNSSGANTPTTTQAPAANAQGATSTTRPSGTSSSVSQSTKANEDLVKEYYDLLPDKVDQAWSLLTVNLQNNSGGKGAFDRFWGSIDDIKVLRIDSSDQNTVVYRLRFERKDKKESRETWKARVIEQGGRLLIDTAERIRLGGSDDIDSDR
jgi:serine/threonine protein kinase